VWSSITTSSPSDLDLHSDHVEQNIQSITGLRSHDGDFEFSDVNCEEAHDDSITEQISMYQSDSSETQDPGDCETNSIPMDDPEPRDDGIRVKKSLGMEKLSNKEPVKIRKGAQCQLCNGKSFSCTSNLMRHIERVHKRPVGRLKKEESYEYGGWKITKTKAGFSCICGVEETQLADIRTHILRQHFGKPN